MKIYTRTGDEGTTGLYAGPRISKDHPRIEAYGTVDELNAALGMARAETLPAGVDRLLQSIQNTLFAIGAELATIDSRNRDIPTIHPAQIQTLEQAIDEHDSQLPPLGNFILPAGSRGTASLHVARAICRRAERRVVTLRNMEGESVSTDVLIYLNRLGDLLFVLSRFVTNMAGETDVPWNKQPGSPPA